MLKTTSIFRVTIVALVFWSSAIGGLLAWNLDVAKKHVKELATKEARANFNKDVAFRKWATSHGGVYVPITERTPPNPGLAHIPERDIETPSGKKLTLMNPAYMLRQIMQDYSDLYGVKGKITSFKLINPNNAPDAWEAEALRKFEQGVTEVFELVNDGANSQLRLMRPMVTEKGCLKCHAFQGYKVGDIRGGIGVKIEMRPYWTSLAETSRMQWLTFGAIWFVGALGIWALAWIARKRLEEHLSAEVELNRRSVALAKANEELMRFATVSAHHLQEPARRLVSFAQRLRERLGKKLDDDEEARVALEYIEQGATRQKNLTRDIELYLAAGSARSQLSVNEVSPVLEEIKGNLSQRIRESGARIETGSLPPAFIDRPRLTALFEVLIDNAIIHHAGDTPPIIRISGQTTADGSRYRVEDNGPGIDEEYRQRVFEVFERLDSRSSGRTGVGLSIARRIVESRQGRIWIEASTTLGGAALVFELPKKG